MSLYIQQLAKLISNQLGRLYRHFGANSDGAAWFLICTGLISQHSVHVGPMFWTGIRGTDGPGQMANAFEGLRWRCSSTDRCAHCV